MLISYSKRLDRMTIIKYKCVIWQVSPMNLDIQLLQTSKRVIWTCSILFQKPKIRSNLLIRHAKLEHLHV